jgi:hypothetical protein
VIDDAGDELQHIPADGSGSRPRTADRLIRLAALCDELGSFVRRESSRSRTWTTRASNENPLSYSNQ